MAVNFPDSPSNGDTFVVGSLTYTYAASTDVWDASGVTSATIQISDTAPSSPSDGELWHNSSDLKLYIYYNDGSSSQWVVASPQQIGPAGPTGSFSGTLTQSIIPDTDSAYDLGSATHKFRSLYLSSDTLYIGDSASISAGSGGEIILPSLKIGKGANAVRLEADASGKLKTKKVVGGVTQAAEEPGKATVVADMAGLIAVTGMSTGQTALVTSLNKVFMYTGSAWYLIATMTNVSPTDITGVNATYALAIDGTATVVTVASTDPEGFPLTFSHAVTAGSLGSTATVVQGTGASVNVFTITPSSTEADAGTFSITFSVTDGANGAVNAVSAFTLAFGDDPGRQSYYKGSPAQSNSWITSHNWTVPAGVTSICVLCIGAGGGGGGPTGSRGGGGGGLAWKNDIPVTAGDTYKVNVGTAGWRSGGSSGDPNPLNATNTYFSTAGNVVILRANGGYTNSGYSHQDNPGGAGYIATGSAYGTGTMNWYTGGAGGRHANGKWGGGGGAAGYSGNGGRGGWGTQASYQDGVNGSGGGGGGSGSGNAAVGGGGTGIYGQGSNGAGSAASGGWTASGGGGSGGENSQGAGNGEGGNYGGGGGYYGKGGDATIQIIWGRGRSYPNTLTSSADDT